MSNKSGIEPTGGHLLILPDKVEEKTEGGIYLPQDTREKEQLAATIGTLVAIGSSAWNDIDDGSPWAAVGDRVSYSRYAGVAMKGQDSEDYVLINDNDILARLLF
jgi:chaperonin GroES